MRCQKWSIRHLNLGKGILTLFTGNSPTLGISISCSVSCTDPGPARPRPGAAARPEVHPRPATAPLDARPRSEGSFAAAERWGVAFVTFGPNSPARDPGPRASRPATTWRATRALPPPIPPGPGTASGHANPPSPRPRPPLPSARRSRRSEARMPETRTAHAAPPGTPRRTIAAQHFPVRPSPFQARPAA